MKVERDEILHLRQNMGISQEALAREVGVSWRTVARWESGESKPSQLAHKVLEVLYLKYGRSKGEKL